MKYEFHVGDYVEMADGLVGWVCQVKDDDCICVADQYVTGKYVTGYYHIPEELRYFNRIGQYDFTKNDEGKIEPLSDNYIESFPIFKTQDTITGKTYQQECYSIDIDVMGKKINELVEAVNRLEEKVNGMA